MRRTKPWLMSLINSLQNQCFRTPPLTEKTIRKFSLSIVLMLNDLNAKMLIMAKMKLNLSYSVDYQNPGPTMIFG